MFRYNRRASPCTDNACENFIKRFWEVSPWFKFKMMKCKHEKKTGWPDANTTFSDFRNCRHLEGVLTLIINWIDCSGVSYSHLFSEKWSHSIFWSIPRWLINRILFALIVPAARGKIHNTTPLCCAKVRVVFSVVIYQRFNVVETLSCSA